MNDETYDKALADTFGGVTAVGDTEGLTKLSFNATPRTMAALRLAVQIGGDNNTDTLNRAVQLYALHVTTVAGGGRFLIQGADRNLQTLDFS